MATEQAELLGELAEAQKTPGGSPFFQWTEVSFDLSIMARFLWRLVFNLLNLTFSNPKNPIFTEIGGGDNC